MKTLDGIKRRLTSWARRPQERVSSPVQPDFDGGAPMALGEVEISALCSVYGRAILIHICRDPRTFGFNPETDGLWDFSLKATSYAEKLGEAIRANGGVLAGVTDPAMPVWRTAAKLTTIDAKMEVTEKICQ